MPLGCVNWNETDSYIGGLPMLGEHPWPRTPAGVPLTFCAQIDLETVTALRPDTGLPQTGLLLFFCDTVQNQHGSVVYLGTAGSLRQPPARTPHAFGEYYGRSLLKHDNPLCVVHTLPCWPVEFHSAPYEEEVDDDGNDPLELEAANPEFCRPRLVDLLIEHKLAPDAALRETGFVWHASVKILAGHLIRELSACRETLLAQIIPDTMKSRAQRAWIKHAPLRWTKGYKPFRKFVLDLWSWSQEQPAWAELHDEDRKRLWQSTERLDEEFRRFAPDTRSLYSVGLGGAEKLARNTVRHAVTGGDEAWLALPEPVREHINNHELAPGDDPERHQMFGQGRMVQAGVYERLNQLLLLQLTYDSFGSLWPGDVGIMTWWIRPEHLKAREWAQTEFMFECH
ncbi:DUF1963 domain-containing protein [Ruegeria arenilitoris]|uniref:DUF1963 domain-containing protein n=1 Tax=Ruegeria arenilitoris TaxID=1173585 RepID=UPI0026700539|nr:DUF1963 domain-containing protein [Ruegeria arenilitoris]